ncbi:DUF4405 domain-containing protein [Paenibacillus sp. FSL R7-0273]|uniref:DUF4405 domain-containing protein n=1 Tax=Paenibacillus sp. FSL R7-0273 TaxID=1536772 RepID=UPI0006946FA0|nr:DUF4405 domain-containing protein [Paenibacillus sp. FSL R7-0273]
MIKPKMIIRLSIDTLMTVLFIIMMAYRLTGNTAHEWTGMTLFTLFIIHNVLNLNWYKAIFKGKYSVVRVIRTAVNLLLLLAMVGMMVSGLIISQTVFSLIPFIGIDFGRKLHHLSAYWGFILMSIHLGLHWVMIMGAARRMRKSPKATRTLVLSLRLIAAIIAGYGLYAFFKREIGQYLVLYYSYSFWDYEQLAVLFFIDFITIMGLCVFITYYVMKRVQKSKR